MGGIDLLVHHPDLDRGVHPTGDALVLGGQFLVQRLTLIIGCSGKFALVQDAHGCFGAHHCDLGVRPGEHLGGAQ